MQQEVRRMNRVFAGDYAAGEKIFKEYILKGFLGEGSFGRVYLVENRIGVSFALKILYKGVRMEKRGADAVMGIRSNRLVSVLNYGKTTEDEDCVLMEYVQFSLGSILRHGKIGTDMACAYFIEILRGLNILETNNILHRDIKPENLFVLEDVIKIGDFGTARYTSGETSQKSAVIGTLHYMAPECFHNQYGFSGDRWSAAVVFYRMLTGRFPFGGDSYAGIFGAIMSEEPNFDIVPEKYRPFFRKCFEKTPEKRHESVEEMLKDVKNVCGTVQPEISHEFSGDLTNRAKPCTPIHFKPKSVRPEEKEEFRLRCQPINVPHKKFHSTLGLNGSLRPFVYIENKFRDNHDGTISDDATGLMWQQAGSHTYLEYEEISEYVRLLNLECFAGCSDWRLPTVEELISLLTQEKQSNDLYIDPMFDKKQHWCWSADRYSPRAAWHVHFDQGYFHCYEESFYVRAVRTSGCPSGE